MKYALMQALLGHLEVYEAERPGHDQSLWDFVVWMQQRQATSRPVSQDPSLYAAPENVPVIRQQAGPGVEVISKYLIYLYRYARGYIKKGIEGSGLSTPDDFTYLITLLGTGSMTKTELIEQSVHEKTSGMEVIRRLLEAGWITQEDDPQDRRSKRISLTPAGRMLVIGLLDNMRKVTQIIRGNLTAEEEFQLATLLHKLEHFHRPLYIHERDATLDELVDRTAL